jgi:S1-C subfamily serine protease
MDALARGESKERVRLGIGVAPMHVARRMRRAVGLPDADGLLVRMVEDDSPASQAGLAQGDLIVLAGGKPVGGVDDLFEALGTAGGTIQLIILRGADERAVDVQLGASAGDQ